MENKKNPAIDLRKKSGLYLNIGLAISLLFVLLAFEYKSYESPSKFTYSQTAGFEEPVIMPITTQLPPPPPKEIVIIAIPDDIEIEIPKSIIDNTFEEVTRIESPIEIEEPKEELIDEGPIYIVELMPTYPGGLKAMYKYFGKKTRYPAQARKMGVEGKVILTFAIDKDGSITNIKLIRGIGAGCDKEAIRVLESLPKWNPGKQRGKPVKVQMTLPIYFKLN